MSRTDRDKWDRKFREGAYANRTHPTQLLAAHEASFPRGRALDVACGAGRNALFLASRGFEVDAVDVSSVGLQRVAATAAERSLDVNCVQADLDDGIPGEIGIPGRYSLIIVVRYVNLPLIRDLRGMLADGGGLICEEHLATDLPDMAGPSNPAFRVPSGALLDALGGLRVLYYSEGTSRDPDGRKVALAQAIATRGGTSNLEYC